MAIGFLGRIPLEIRGGMMLATGISIFGLTDNLTLFVSDTISVGQFHLSRSLIAIVLLIIVGWMSSTSVLPRNWLAVGLRTLFIVSSMMLYFSVLPMMPLAEAGAGLFTSPIFVLLFSKLIFKESIGYRRVMAVAVGSIGVLLVLKPGGGGFTPYHLLPTIAGALYAMCSTTTYQYCRNESPLALTMGFLVTIAVVGAVSTSAMTVFPASDQLLAEAPFLFRGWAEVDGMFWLIMMAIAGAGMIAMILINNAYQVTPTSYAVVYEYTYLIAAGLGGWLIWGSVPDGWSLIGIAMIIAAGVIITLAQQAALEETTPEKTSAKDAGNRAGDGTGAGDE